MKDAQYYNPLKTDRSIATLFYKWINIKYNDGTNQDVFHYFSSCGGGWIPSHYNGKNIDEFINNNLIKIQEIK